MEKIRKRNLSLALAFIFVLALVFVPVLPANNFTPVTGWEMMGRLGLGINIGNTLEARPWLHEAPVSNHMDTEVYWGGARIEEWHFKAIAQKGFTHVRIPVSWEPHMDANYNINGEWMARVQQCVDWALAEGLYVTLNTHHESGFYDLMHNGPYEEARRWLTTVWAQIAERFKNYPEQLIFEPMNEPRPGAEGWYWDYNRFASEIPVLSGTANRLNRDALALIRASGGNNARRVVALTITQADPNLIHLYEHPNDPYTMLGVFFYPGSGSLNRNNERRILAQLTTALNNRIPIVIKETSPIEIRRQRDALAWGRFVYEELAKLGIPSVWWNCTGTGVEELFNRHTGEWNNPMVEVFFRQYGKEPGAAFAPPPPELPITLSWHAKDNEFSQWRPDKRALNAARRLIVEYEGSPIISYSFALMSASDWKWQQFDRGHRRVSEEPGRIIFDIRNIDKDTLHFATWSTGDASRITRVYITN